MKCIIVREVPGRMRVHLAQKTKGMTCRQADLIEDRIVHIPGVIKVKIYLRSGNIAVNFDGADCRAALVEAFSLFDFEDYEENHLVPVNTGRAINEEYKEKLIGKLVVRTFKKLYLPMPCRMVVNTIKSFKYVAQALKSLAHGRLDVSVLDATAIVVSLIRGDVSTAGSIMFLLGVGDLLEEWTHKKSVDDLARTMALNVDKVWVKAQGTEVLVNVSDVQVGDTIIVHTGNVIPLDGKVSEGEASVNQASMTGESLPVRKTAGSYVYAGTVIEEGQCCIVVDKAAGSGRYDKIVTMIEESEKLKSAVESKASHLADKLVPYSFAGTALTYLLSRNTQKALSFLMVDFSCALNLSMPLAVLSAMREAGKYGMTVKGGKFLEAVSDATTIVFDKTGTLTHAVPTVAEVIPFNGWDENEALRLAACLEEHYPHSMANAVVKEAQVRGLNHEEKHSKVEYVVAHGISSKIDRKKALIGSYHFVFEDEKCKMPTGKEKTKFDNISDEYSHLYLSVSGKLAAVICIKDPIREEAPEVIRTLHQLGIEKVAMMTGDNERTARAVAEKLGLDEYHAEVLPEDKAEFIRKEHELGHKVIMIGDGINDTPALSEADVGIAVSDGAAIAREIADITIATDNLYALPMLRYLSDRLMNRIHRNYRFIMSFNLGLIGLGVLGVMVPGNSALLHNLSTIAISLESMTSLVKDAPEALQEPMNQLLLNP